MTAPFESLDRANAAVKGFQDDLLALVEKYGFVNAYNIVRVDWIAKDGEAASGVITAAFGDELQHETMLGFAFGMVQRERQERIGKLMSGGAMKHRKAKDFS